MLMCWGGTDEVRTPEIKINSMSDEGKALLELQLVPPQVVCNLPPFEGYLIIDCRSQAEFALGHIQTAVSFPYDGPFPELGDQLDQFLRDLERQCLQPDRWDPVVLYGDPTSPAATRQVSRLAKLLGLAVSRLGAGHPATPWPTFARGLAATAHLVSIAGGYPAFSQQYPWLCWLAADPASQEMRPMPYHVVSRHSNPTEVPPRMPLAGAAPGAGDLFLGARSFDLADRAALGRMGVTHLLIDGPGQAPDWGTPAPWPPALPGQPEADERVHPGLVYLMCATAPPEPQQAQGGDGDGEPSMGPCWDATSAFIEGAWRAGGRVLVQLHGRSNSAAVIMVRPQAPTSSSPHIAQPLLGGWVRLCPSGVAGAAASLADRLPGLAPWRPAWLIDCRGWSFEAAAGLLATCCPLIDPALICARQLQQRAAARPGRQHNPNPNPNPNPNRALAGGASVPAAICAPPPTAL
ncbi:hypothetical protein PAPYR_9739 [Paratrimastix pyriformis]|uniref:Rhodanese domain-containing protein n=1 Tax=Paratrimastix pyriformis TaxID=342808 RepID=A0ABQ8UAG9_9EUKA|nr:hypothetical protein PAPYR_9739 [Paratrimastix pyriformis]